MIDNCIFDNSITGRPQEVRSTVLRKISAHTRGNIVRWFKIGITSNPESRFERHKRYYDEMIIIYRSSSLQSVCELECELIEHNKEIADNFIGGGGGRSGNPPYFMYVVVKYLR